MYEIIKIKIALNWRKKRIRNKKYVPRSVKKMNKKKNEKAGRERKERSWQKRTVRVTDNTREDKSEYDTTENEEQRREEE